MIPRKIRSIISIIEQTRIGYLLLEPLRIPYETLIWRHRSKRSVRLLTSMYDDMFPEFPIPGLKIEEIEVEKQANLYDMNPSAFFSSDGDSGRGSWKTTKRLHLIFRRSSWAFNASSNFRGHIKFEKTEGRFGYHLWTKQTVFNQLLQTIEHEKERPDVLWDYDPECNLEDPRYFEMDGEDWILCSRVTQDEHVPTQVLHRITALNLRTKRRIDFSSPFGRQTEKNWAPIIANAGVLFVLYSNNPFIVLELNLTTGAMKEVANSSSCFPSTHGGSPFLRIGQELFMRVSRIKVPLHSKGFVHFSFLSLHDSSFREIAMSKPFVLRTLGLEVCNGLAMKPGTDTVYLSWGENDRRLFIANIQMDALLKWFFDNLMISQATAEHKGMLGKDYLTKRYLRSLTS